MTNLENILKEKGISLYKISNILGKSAASSSNYLKNQINGNKPMKYNDYIMLVKELGLTEDQVPFEIVKVRVK